MRKLLTALALTLTVGAQAQVKTNLAGPGVYGTLPVTKGGTGYAAANIAALKVYLGLGFVAEELAKSGSTFSFDTDKWTTPSNLESEGNITTTAGQFTGSGAGITGIVDSALSSNIPLKNGVNAFTNANTVTVPTGTAVTGTGTISATLLGDLSANTGADGTVGVHATSQWWAQKFTAAATGTVTAVSTHLKYTGGLTPATSTITAYIFSDDAGTPAAPNAVLTGGTGTAIPFSGLPANYTNELYFGGMSASVTSGVAYWVVYKCSTDVSAGGIAQEYKAHPGGGTYLTWNDTAWSKASPVEFAAYLKVHSAGGVGLSGTSTINNGVMGSSTVGYGGSFTSTRSYGVYGESTSGVAVRGTSGTSYGGYFSSTSGSYGLYAIPGIYAYGKSYFLGTTAQAVLAEQSGSSSTNAVISGVRTSASNGTGPILLLNNAGSAATGNLITAQTGGVDKFTVSASGAVVAAGGVTANTFPLIQWRGSAGSDPTENLVEGQMYWNTSGYLKIYTGLAWVIVGIGP